MKFVKPVNVWETLDQDLRNLQVGQWVYAGDPSNRGIWCGVRSTGSKVVAWEGNIKSQKNPSQYIRNLINYAKG